MPLRQRAVPLLRTEEILHETADALAEVMQLVRDAAESSMKRRKARRPKPIVRKPEEPPREICGQCGGTCVLYTANDSGPCPACCGTGVKNRSGYRSINDPENLA